MPSLSQRFRAWVALAAFVATFGFGTLDIGHLGPDDDAACGASALPGHPKAQFETVKIAPPVTHCPFCHWQRVVSGGHPGAVGAQVSPLEPVALVLPPASQLSEAAPLDGYLSRGPPARA